MAFGFTPKYQQIQQLNDLTHKTYIAIALQTIKKLGWKLSYVSRSGLVAYKGGGIFSTSHEIKITFQESDVLILSSQVTNEMYDRGKNKRNVEDFIQTFESTLSDVNEGNLSITEEEVDTIFDSDEEDQLALPPPTAKDNLKSFLSIFTPVQGYFITPIIVDITILVFIIMAITGVNIFTPGSEDLLAWGANFRPLTLSGQWWRTITNIFLHIGILHLLLNMYALLYVGLLLEPFLGKTRFLVSYIFTGIIVSLVSSFWHPLTVSAGASGAIFGMYGVFFAMLTTNLIDKAFRKALLTSITVFVIFNLANGLKEGIDNAAHVGGLLSGLIIGYIFYPSLKNPNNVKHYYSTLSASAVIFVVLSITIYSKTSTDVLKYQTAMDSFADEEVKALKFYSLPPNSSQQLVINAVDSGLIHWNNGIKFINEAKKLDIPKELTSKLSPLEEYSNLRIKTYQLIKKSLINNNNGRYADSLATYSNKIDSIIDKMNGK